MNLGSLNRAGKLYSNTQTVGTGGAVTDAVVFVRDIWLSYTPPSTKTVIAGARDAEQTETVFQTRWFDGLKDGMRLVTEGRTYRIVRHDELGRREGWRIYGREVA